MKVLYLIVISVFFISGCSIFHGSRRMDMTPFAENTSTFFGEAIKIERPFQFKQLQPYTSLPEFQEMRKEAIPVISALRGIVFYSNQVVAINNSKLSEKDKCRMLAAYLEEVMEKALEKQRADTLQVDIVRARGILNNIRNSKTYLDGLAAAEPIVHGVVSAVDDRIDVIQNAIPVILNALNREIEKDFGQARANYIQLLTLQQKLILSMTHLYNAQMGDREELEKMLDENASLRYFIPSPEKANHDNLLKTEDYLTAQLNEIDVMLKQMEEIKTIYRAKQDEVVAWRSEIDSKIMMARTSLAIWARAHKNLGAGIPVPPMIDVAGIAGNLAGSAANVVVP
jgi:hypothetical protein